MKHLWIRILIVLPLISACNLTFKKRPSVSQDPADLFVTWNENTGICTGDAGRFQFRLVESDETDYRIEVRPLSLIQEYASYTFALTDDALEGFALQTLSLSTAEISSTIAISKDTLVELNYLSIQRSDYFDTEYLVKTSQCRLPEVAPYQETPPSLGTLEPIASLRWNGGPWKADRILVIDERLYVAGAPHEMAVLGIHDPTQPTLEFSAADNMESFAAQGPWNPTTYASRNLVMLNTYLLSLGTGGVSAMKHPSLDSLTVGAQAALPGVIGIGRGWREDHFLAFTQNSITQYEVSPPQLESMGMSLGLPSRWPMVETTAFGRRTMVRTARDTQVVLATPNGFTPPRTVANVSGPLASSTHYWYVHSETAATGQPGFVAYDRHYHPVAVFPGAAPKNYAVSEDGQYFFVNHDDQRISVYLANWP